MISGSVEKCLIQGQGRSLCVHFEKCPIAVAATLALGSDNLPSSLCLLLTSCMTLSKLSFLFLKFFTVVKYT